MSSGLFSTRNLFERFFRSCLVGEPAPSIVWSADGRTQPSQQANIRSIVPTSSLHSKFPTASLPSRTRSRRSLPLPQQSSALRTPCLLARSPTPMVRLAGPHGNAGGWAATSPRSGSHRWRWWKQSAAMNRAAIPSMRREESDDGVKNQWRH